MEQNNTVSMLRAVPIFSDLEDNELDVVARYTRPYRFRKGEAVFTEGSTAKELYVIQEGEILITKKTNGRKTVDLARFISGESFGELDLFDSAPMSATAVAERDTTLLVFPHRETKLEGVMREHPAVFAIVLRRLLAVVAGRIRTANKLISERAPWIQELRAQLLTDKLTGLYNRSYIDEELPRLLPGEGGHASILVLKPDNFKQVNDTFGHDAGDAALKQIAGFVKSSLEGMKGAAVRYRGDEFALVLLGVETREAEKTAERLRSAIKELDLKPIAGTGGFRLAASVGVAGFPEHAGDGVTLAHRAHEAMLAARNGGGDRVTVAPDGR
jgi:diguanylate cyclase (GGDEF)-like protein